MAKIEEYQQDSNLQTKCQLSVCLKLVVVKYASSQTMCIQESLQPLVISRNGGTSSGVALVVGSVSDTIPAMTTLDKPTIKPIAG